MAETSHGYASTETMYWGWAGVGKLELEEIKGVHKCISLHAKQSFQSNKTHRKLCEVLTTYQGLYYRKTLKKKV